MKYVIQLIVTMIVETSAENPEFFFEEHNCIDNLVDQLAMECEWAGEKSTCATCYRSDVKLLREATEEDIKKYGPNCEPPTETTVTP